MIATFRTLAAEAAPTAAPIADTYFTPFLNVLVDVGIVMTTLAILLCLLRILRGPTLIDRGIAADTVAIQVAALVLLITIRLESLVDFDAVLIVSILGFVSTLAFAQFIGRRGSTT